jgi:MraZ protein
VADLYGQHTYQLDPKGRISLPARFRAAFAEGAFLTLGHDGCLFAFPKEEWERQRQEIRGPLFDTDTRAYARMFFGNADPVELDAQGRLLVSLRLRQRVGIGRDAVVVGVGDHLEVWERSTWERYEQANLGAYEAGALSPRAGRRDVQ